MVDFNWNQDVTTPEENKTSGENFNIKTDKITVDTQEPDKIINLLIRNGIKYDVAKLEVGDFVRGNVCVERKTMSDFIQSKRSHHLDKQLMQMEERYEKSFLIISGSFKSIAFDPQIKGWTVNHHMGTLASIAVRYPRVKVLQVDNDTQLVNLMVRIMDKAHDGKVPTIYDTELMRNKMTDEDVKVKMLSCIPKVGLKKAKELSDIIDVVLFDKVTNDVLQEEHLYEVKGIGPMLSEEILKINGD